MEHGLYKRMGDVQSRLDATPQKTSALKMLDRHKHPLKQVENNNDPGTRRKKEESSPFESLRQQCIVYTHCITLSFPKHT